MTALSQNGILNINKSRRSKLNSKYYSESFDTNLKCSEKIRGGADKSLARPGRKQATATKIGIYSTHSPRSSVHLYYIKNQQDATLAVLFISNCKFTLHVSDAFCAHHQEY